MDSTTAEQLADTARSLMVVKMYSLASCVMLFYDIAITFEDEVEKIWNQPRYTNMTLLWTLNRYLTPLSYIVIIASFHMDWSNSVCDRYILFPEALKTVTTFVIGVIFVLRLYAIYGKNQYVAGFATIVLLVQLALKIWAFTDGTRLVLPDGIVGCILVGRHDERIIFTWIAELIFDTIVFGLTLLRTILHYRLQQGRPTTLLTLILRDGVTYFAVLFVANAVTVFIYLWAPPNIKAINASFGTLITSLMVSRLILSLKNAAQSTNVYNSSGRISVNHHGEESELAVTAKGMSFSDKQSIPMDTFHLTANNLFITRQELSQISMASSTPGHVYRKGPRL